MTRDYVVLMVPLELKAIGYSDDIICCSSNKNLLFDYLNMYAYAHFHYFKVFYFRGAPDFLVFPVLMASLVSLV